MAGIKMGLEECYNLMETGMLALSVLSISDDGEVKKAVIDSLGLKNTEYSKESIMDKILGRLEKVEQYSLDSLDNNLNKTLVFLETLKKRFIELSSSELNKEMLLDEEIGAYRFNKVFFPAVGLTFFGKHAAELTLNLYKEAYEFSHITFNNELICAPNFNKSDRQKVINNLADIGYDDILWILDMTVLLYPALDSSTIICGVIDNGILIPKSLHFNPDCYPWGYNKNLNEQIDRKYITDIAKNEKLFTGTNLKEFSAYMVNKLVSDMAELRKVKSYLNKFANELKPLYAEIAKAISIKDKTAYASSKKIYIDTYTTKSKMVNTIINAHDDLWDSLSGIFSIYK